GAATSGSRSRGPSRTRGRAARRTSIGDPPTEVLRVDAGLEMRDAAAVLDRALVEDPDLGLIDVFTRDHAAGDVAIDGQRPRFAGDRDEVDRLAAPRPLALRDRRAGGDGVEPTPLDWTVAAAHERILGAATMPGVGRMWRSRANSV